MVTFRSEGMVRVRLWVEGWVMVKCKIKSETTHINYSTLNVITMHKHVLT